MREEYCRWPHCKRISRSQLSAASDHRSIRPCRRNPRKIHAYPRYGVRGSDPANPPRPGPVRATPIQPLRLMCKPEILNRNARRKGSSRRAHRLRFSYHGVPFTKWPRTIFQTKSNTCSIFPPTVVRFRPLVVYLPIENSDVPMMFRGTKPHSPRGSERVKVETIGGRTSRQVLPRSRPRNQNGAGLSDIRPGALQNEKIPLSCCRCE
jgi:hypothetical protein